MEKFAQNKNLCATLLKLKQLHRVSYKKMGDVIGYTDIGMSKALKNNTLSIDQAELIIKTLKLGPDKAVADPVTNEAGLIQLAIRFVENYDKVKHLKVVKNLIELEILRVDDSFQGQINSIREDIHTLHKKQSIIHQEVMNNNNNNNNNKTNKVFKQS